MRKFSTINFLFAHLFFLVSIILIPNNLTSTYAQDVKIQPSCRVHDFVSGSLSTQFVTQGQTLQMRCNYGGRYSGITAYTSPTTGANCVFSNWESATSSVAIFNCTASGTAGSYSAFCKLPEGGAINSCGDVSVIGSFVVSATPSVTECTDSDGGYKLDVAGTAALQNRSVPDKCITFTSATAWQVTTSGTHVQEATCSRAGEPANIYQTIEVCKGGSCVDGACVTSTSTDTSAVCTDSDGGYKLDVAGTASLQKRNVPDKCIAFTSATAWQVATTGTHVQEATCSRAGEPANIYQTIEVCKGGSCANGACVTNSSCISNAQCVSPKVCFQPPSTCTTGACTQQFPSKICVTPTPAPPVITIATPSEGSILTKGAGSVIKWTQSAATVKTTIYLFKGEKNGNTMVIGTIRQPASYGAGQNTFTWTVANLVMDNGAITSPPPDGGSYFIKVVARNTNGAIVAQDSSDYFTITSPNLCLMRPKGDADCNNIIQQEDYLIFKIQLKGSTKDSPADFNKNGTVDLVDFEIWRTNMYEPVQQPI